MSEFTLQRSIEHWIEASEYFEKNLISEDVFLHAQAEAVDIASNATLNSIDDAASMLKFIKLLWKDETGAPTTPCQIAMDKMLGHVVDFLHKTV